LTNISKFVVGNTNTTTLALLYGLSTGFCGSLTTTSTFVNELNGMKRTRSRWKYATTSYLLSQLGFLLFLNAYSWSVVPQGAIDTPRMDVCRSFEDVCSSLLAHGSCPPNLAVSDGCGGTYGEASHFTGVCTCGSFDAAERVSELLVDAMLKFNVTSGLVAQWPSFGGDGGALNGFRDKPLLESGHLGVDDGGASYAVMQSMPPMFGVGWGVDHPSETIDFCMSYENSCEAFLDRIQCAPSHRDNHACERDRKSVV
jgi:hypothetical protein